MWPSGISSALQIEICGYAADIPDSNPIREGAIVIHDFRLIVHFQRTPRVQWVCMDRLSSTIGPAKRYPPTLDPSRRDCPKSDPIERHYPSPPDYPAFF
jgi:hypothetical protein